MERARVVAPSVSLAAHLGGATFLVLGLTVLPERLPSPGRGGLETLAVSRSFAVSLAGGGPLRGRARTAPVRVAPVVSPMTLPRAVSEAIPDVPLEPAAGAGVPGAPEDVVGGGGGVGLCLANCGPGDAAPGGVVLPAVEPPAAPVRFRQGGDLREPVKVRYVAPDYPALAIAARVEGRVVLDCVIDADGRVSSVSVLRSHPLLEAAAVAAVSQWRYRPTLLNGVPVSVLLTVTLEFHLR